MADLSYEVNFFGAANFLGGGVSVGNTTGFQRIFLIFTNEDAGYEEGQKPSGHIRIEVRNGLGKIRAAAQNLKRDSRYDYKLYLIKSSAKEVMPVFAGKFEFKLNKAEAEWEFDPWNVGMSGYGISDFNIAAVLLEYADRENNAVICPLAAYRSGKTDWRSKTADQLYGKKNTAGDERPEYIPSETKPAFNKADTENIFQTAGDKTGKADAARDDTSNESGGPEVSRDAVGRESADGPGISRDGISLEETGGESNVKDNIKQGEINRKTPEQEGSGREDEYEASGNQPEANQNAASDGRLEEKQEAQTSGHQAAGTLGGVNTNCLYMNGNLCGMYLGSGALNPCENCRVNQQKGDRADNGMKTGDVERLETELDNNFEQNDPFYSKRSDYKWWKVTNPVNLNNILYQCGIRSPLLFNPMVMMAHFKYRHLIIGIYSDRASKREYVVCGVPGMHMVDRKPFGDLCKWVQAGGNRLRYGVFGYWLVYVEPATGRLMNLR